MDLALTRSPLRGEVHLVQLDPPRGSEIRKARLCLIVAPDELNRYLRTTLIAPMTSCGHAYPWRIRCRFQDRSGFVALDQIRAVDTERLVKRLGRLTPATLTDVLAALEEMFPNTRGRTGCRTGPRPLR